VSVHECTQLRCNQLRSQSMEYMSKACTVHHTFQQSHSPSCITPDKGCATLEPLRSYYNIR
jgi:hypothetical protein